VANHQRDLKKEAFWRRKLQLWKDSGLSVRAFCDQHGLAEPSFYYWRERIRQADLDAAPVQPTTPASTEQPVPLFLPIRLAAVPEPIEVVLADGTLVRVPPSFDADALRRLLAVLRGQPC
jgi:transposase-like protein